MSASAERLRIANRDGRVALAGQLDAHTAPLLAEQLDPLPEPAADSSGGVGGDVALDMSEVEFVDSSGLRVLVEANRRATDSGRRLVLYDPSPSMRRLLEISGLVGHLATEEP